MNQNYLDQEGYGDEDGKDEHATQTVKMQRASTRTVHQRDGDERHDDHDQANADGGVLGVGFRQPRGDKQVG